MTNYKSPHFADGTDPLHIYESTLGTLYFYEHIVVGEFYEGVSLSYQTAFNLLLKAIQFIGTRSVVYISNRINLYSVQPNDYKYLERVPNIKGIAIVSTHPRGISNATLEAKFVSKKFEVFDALQEAHEWAKSLLGPI